MIFKINFINKNKHDCGTEVSNVVVCKISKLVNSVARWAFFVLFFVSKVEPGSFIDINVDELVRALEDSSKPKIN